MRRLAVVVLLVLAVSSAAYGAPPVPHYLALGDSLAQGVQPQLTGDPLASNQGYVDGVYAFYRLRHPSLQLTKLGCSGENTTTMITGGVCNYPLVTQLAQALDFLHTHRVVLVTITIGGDNLLHCISAAGIDPACAATGVQAIKDDLPLIINALRAAAGSKVPIVAGNYYDPFLAAWTLLPGGQQLAKDSLGATVGLNLLLAKTYGPDVPVADVARAFHITEFANVPAFDVPLNVFLSLTWTWMGAPPPRGPDIHPNAVGYAVIAGAFIRTIGPL